MLEENKTHYQNLTEAASLAIPAYDFIHSSEDKKKSAHFAQQKQKNG